MILLNRACLSWAVMFAAAVAVGQQPTVTLDGWGLPPDGNMFTMSIASAPNNHGSLDKLEPVIMGLLLKSKVTFIWPDREIRFENTRVKMGESFELSDGNHSFNLYPTEIKLEKITFHCAELGREVTLERKPPELGSAKPAGFAPPVKKIVVK